MAIPLIAGALAAPIAGGILGNIFSGSDRAEQERLLKEAAQQYDTIGLPEQQALQLEAIRQLGQYAPETEQAYKLGPTSYEQIQTDPRLRDAQMQALSEMQGIVEGGGMNAIERAQLEQNLRRAAQEEQIRRASIQSQMARRGMASSGANLVAQLMSQQGSAERASQAGLEASANAQARALQAIQQMGAMGGQIRGQEYGEQSNLAQARDLINRFNLENMQNVQQRNIAQQNLAQRNNLGEQQRIAEANAQQRLQAQQYANQLAQQQFSNKMGIAGGKAGALGSQSQLAGQKAQATQQMWGGIGQGVGAGLGAYGAYKMFNENNKDYGV